MDFKKCLRCGVFFNSSNDVCDCCQTKDEQDLYKLNDFIGNTVIEPTIANLAAGTGISEKNINRYIQNNSFNV